MGAARAPEELVDPARYQQLKEIFHAAIEASPDERAEFVRRRCGDDHDLKSEVALLLGRLDDLDDFLERPSGEPPPATPPPLTPVTPDAPRVNGVARFASYTVLRALGRGGMGTVYLAEQDGTKRSVALKVIHPGLSTPGALRRFALEAQILGRLNHPGIAQIHDASTADGGHGPQPYFAMELVDGVPITRFAQSRGLSAGQRLELLARVCDAIEYAHLKGVIHRDLKPANVLVTGAGTVKVVDFGVARATAPASDSSIAGPPSLRTEAGQWLGTLPYMSPEQVGGDPDDIDTRSDVYALGVIGYELLAGRLPLEVANLPPLEAGRRIQHEEPTALSSLDKLYRGDVETIVAKAIEKEPARRYQSAAALAADIRRYLNHEPIAARPASALYRIEKFSRRNLGLVAGLAAALTLLVAGAVGTGLSLHEAIRARDLEARARAKADAAQQAEAEQRVLADAQRDRAVAAETEANKRAEELSKVSEFQSEMLTQLDPARAGQRLSDDVRAQAVAALSTLPEEERAGRLAAFQSVWEQVNTTDAARGLIEESILRPAAEALERQFADQPVVSAMLRQVLADRYRALGMYDQALTLQEAALATFREQFGETGTRTLSARVRLGSLLSHMDRLDAADAVCRDTLESCRRQFGDDHQLTLLAASNLGELFLTRQQPALAEPLFRDALARQRRLLGEEHPGTLTSVGLVGIALRMQGKHAEAEPFYRESLEKTRRVRGEDHADTLGAMVSLAVLLESEAKFAEAEPVALEAFGRARRAVGEEHPITLAALNALLTVLTRSGQLERAQPYAEELLDKCRRRLGPRHRFTVTAMANRGALLVRLERFAEAEPVLRETLGAARHAFGEEHPDTVASIVDLGRVLNRQGKHAEAVALLAPAEPAVRRVHGGPADTGSGRFLVELAAARAGVGDFVGAEAGLLEAHGVVSRGSPRTASYYQCAKSLAEFYAERDRQEPGGKYTQQAGKWKATLDELDSHR